MNFRWRNFFLFLSLLALPTMSRAQDSSDGTLHILRPSINAEQETAELCLEFDHALDLADRNKVIAALRLQSGRKQIPLSIANVSLGTATLCIQGLAHRGDYSIAVNELHGSGGEKLAETYKLSFTVPDRRPTLAFAGESVTTGLARMKDNEPVLRAVNVSHADILLYRITDPAKMVDAFNQRMQTTLAPSETFTFAKDNGQLIWRGKAVLDESEDGKLANRNVEQPIALHAIPEALVPGLYLVVAIDTAPPAESKKPNADIAPITAAQWFLRSDLKLRSLRKQDGFAVETENVNAAEVTKDARVILFGREGKILGEAKSDADGMTFMPNAADKRGDAVTIFGLTSAGDVDFADLTAPDSAGGENRFTLTGLDTAITLDRSFYAPGNEAFLALTARNSHGEAINTPGSSLQLQRPGGGFYANISVNDGKAGIAYASFPAPSIHGLWNLQWRQPDGRVLAEKPLRITSNPDAPHLTWTADRPMLGGDGEVKLSIKAITDAGKPAPYISGHVQLQWQTPDTITGWSDYRFGKNEKNETTPVEIAAFVTDANGNASLRLTLRAPDDPLPLHTALLSLRADNASGTLDADPLVLPVRPNNLVVGIKPLAPGGKFAENSIARFDVIALDGDGKRREDFSLKYQILEEGRSFAWYQAEGRWDYKRMPQRRRIGGGGLDIKATGSNLVRWPVTSGAYTMEITDTAGGVLARFPFDAGWGLLKPVEARPADLTLTAQSSFVRPGTPVKVKFTLDHPAIISVVIADDQIRRIIHTLRAAGENEITFTPEEDWGARIRVRIEAQQKTGDGAYASAGQIELPVRHEPKELEITIDTPGHVAGGQDLKLAIGVNNISGKQSTLVNLLAVPEPKKNGESTRPASILVQNVATDANGKAYLHFGVPQFSGILRLKILAANDNQAGQREMTIAVRRAFDADLGVPSILRLGDAMHAPLVLKNNDMPMGSFRYALSGGAAFTLSQNAEGKANFGAGEEKSFPLDIQPTEAGEEDLRLDISGPHDFRAAYTWPLAVTASDISFEDADAAEIGPRKSWTPPAPAKPRGKSKLEDSIYFLGAQPLFDAPQILAALLETTPFTTGEMAGWLEAARLWEDVIVKAEFAPMQVLRSRQQKLLRRLIARQNMDGGFPALPGGESDLANTGEALFALARSNQRTAQPAIDGAAGWLTQRLANTWFGEDERPARAAAFAALAAVDRLDVSALRYFAETSAGKTLPPLAMAHLASALAKSNDQDKANTWLNSLRGELAKTPPVALPIVAENNLFNAAELLPVLKELSGNLVHHPSRDPIVQAAFLRSLWAVHARAGRWRAAVNNSERDLSGVFAFRQSGKSAAPALHNPMDRSMWLVESKQIKSPRGESSISRRVYQPDGSQISADQLKRDNIYFMLIEGNTATDKDQKLLVHDASGVGLRAIGCAVDGDAAAAENWGWLKVLGLNDVTSCEINTHGIDAVLTHSDNRTFRTGYFVRASDGGNFMLTPVTARTLTGASWMTGGSMPVQIR